MSVTLYDVLGVVGSLIIVMAYFGTQKGWFGLNDWRFPMLNLIGSILILASLIADWNLGAFVMEIFWILISLYGLAISRRPKI